MIQTAIILAVLGGILGLLLGIADRFLKVEVDERVDTVISMLPGYNCGACGFPGCSGLAEAAVFKGAPVSNCKPCKKDQVEKIVEYLKSAAKPSEK